MVEFHKKLKSSLKNHSSASVSDDGQNQDSASFTASEISSPQKNLRQRINQKQNQESLPLAISQNYFGNDVSEISSNSQPSNNNNTSFTPSKKRPPRRGRKDLQDNTVEDADKPPEKLKEQDLRPPDREENGNFELFWQVIRKQEEPPYQSSIDETVSEEIDLEQLDPNVPVLLEMDQLKEVKLKEGLFELVDEHYDEYERTFDDPNEMETESQEKASSQHETQQETREEETTSEWIQGKYIQYDLNKSLVKTKTGGITWYNPLSFNRWTLESKLRQACIALNEWIWFERIILAFIIINSILLGMYDYMDQPLPNKKKPIINVIVDYSEIVFTFIYCFEMVVKLIALGIIEGKGCYLRLGWNVIDFSVVIVGFVNLTPQFRNLQPLRAFRMLRPLRIAKRMPAMQVLVPTITGCLLQLAAFWLFLTMYIFVFSLFGLQLFSGITHNRCRLTPTPINGDWKLAPGPAVNCGGYQKCDNGFTCGSLLDPTIRSQLYKLSDQDLYRDTLNSDFNWGVSNFDNIYSAMIAVFQCLTLEGQFDLMNQAINGYNYYIGFIYYLLMFLVIYQFLLNLAVAIMVGTIYQKDKEETERDTQLMLELRDKFERVKDIIGVRTLKPKAESKMIYQFIAWTINGLLQYEPGPEPLDARYNYKLFREIWILVEQPAFKLFYLILLLTNLLLLNKFGEPSQENGGLGSFALQLTIIIVINILFALEIVIKLVAYTPKAFASEAMNFLEITIVGIFFLTYSVDCIQAKEIIFMQSWKLKLTQSLIGFNTLRGVRLFNTYLSLRQTRNVVFIMVNCLTKVWNYLIPVVIFIYVFTLFGLDVFAGRLYFDEKHNSIPKFADLSKYRGVYKPRGNFDTIMNSGIAVFQTFVGDQWQTIFFDCVRGAGYRRAVIYWFFLISLGNILLMRFTISFVLWSFKKATMRLNIEGKKTQLKRVVAPTLMDKPEKLTCPVLQDHQNDDYTISQLDINKQDSQMSTERSHLKQKSNQFDKSPNLDFLGNSLSDNQILDDLNSAQLTQKNKRNLAGNSKMKTLGKESNIDGFEVESKTVKFDMESTLGPIEFRLPNDGTNKSRNNVNYPGIGRAHTMQGRPIQNNNLNTLFENNNNLNNSFITEDVGAKDYDDDNREPFSDIPVKPNVEKNQNVKQLKSDFRKLSALPKELTASNWSKLGSDLVQDKSTKIKDKSKSSVQSQKSSANKQDGTELLENITVWSVQPLEVKKVVVKTDDDKEEEDLGKFKQQKAFDWREHMRLSSLFIFHRDSSKRKFADRIAFGGEELRFFKGAQALVDFYKRKPKTLEEILMEAERRKKDDRFIIADKSLDSFEAVQLQFEPEGQKELPINNQQVVKEIWRIRKHEKFNLRDLLDQSVLIDQVRQDRDRKRSLKEKIFGNRERFFVDSDSNQIKMYCVPWYKPTGYQILQVFVQVSIYISVGTLMLENPLATEITSASLIITFLDFACQVVFLYEAAVKIIALGFLYNDLEDKTKIPYIKNMWNALEFVVLIVSWIFLIESNYAALMGKPKLTEQLGVIRTLRMIRILKPLCQMNEMKKLKIACFCLVGSLKEMMTQILMVGTFILIFSISGQAFFANQFWQCIIDDNYEIARNDPRIITKDDCLKLGYRWENPNINFDTIQTSMMGLFQLLLCSGWIDTLRNGIDSVGEGLQPKENNKIYLIVYFIVYVIVARLLLTNMFSAILINSMNNVRDRIDGFDEIYKIQRRWVNVQRLMIQFRPKKFHPLPEGFIGATFTKMLKSKKYERFFLVVMILNAIALCFKFLGVGGLQVTIVNYSSYFFLALYNLDQVIKKMGLAGRYLTKVWNMFDLTIILIADACLALEFGLGYKDLVNAALAFRLLKLVRIFRLAKKIPEFRVVYRTMYIVLIQFLYVLLLQFFTIYIFAVVGMGFYSHVILQNSYNEIANFRSFQNAIILLICCLMGKTWKDVMYELTIQGEYKGVQCVTEVTDEMLMKGEVNGCGSSSAYIFFLIYILTTRMQFLNLFVSFTIDIYLSCCADETEVIKEHDCKLFIKAWQAFDPDASCWIDPNDIPYLVYDLEGELGKKAEYLSRIDEAIKNSDDIEARTKYFYLGSKQMLMPKHFATQLIDELNLPVYQTATGDRCHFKDLVIALAKSRLGSEFENVTSLIIKSWSDDYNILARPKAVLDESTQISRINQSTDKDDRPRDIEAANLPTENQEQRMDTERGLLVDKIASDSKTIQGTPLMQKKSSLRKSKFQSGNFTSQLTVKIAAPERK